MRRKRSPTHAASPGPLPLRRVPEPSGGDLGKLPELAACPDCGASYRTGRWTWEPAPAGAYSQVCPACQRIADRYPAGELSADGSFALVHREELIRLLRHVEERERADHPLKRVMAIEDTDRGFVVQTTDAKLAQALGRALHRAYAGELDRHPTSPDRENLVRVHWRRD